MQLQAPNFDFVATAAQQAGQTIKNYAQSKNIEIDDADAQKAHAAIMEQVAQQYMSATGINDPVKAQSFAAKYFLPKMKSETGSQAAQRWLSVEPTFKAALAEIKQQRYDTTSKDAMKQISGVSTGAISAIQAGERPLEEINKTFGTQYSQEEADKMAGFNPAVSADSMQPIRAPSRETPMDPAAAKALPGAAPMGYKEAQDIVLNLDIPNQQKNEFNPILTQKANQQLGMMIEDNPDMDDRSFIKTVMRAGTPITDEGKAYVSAMQKDEALANKKAYLAMRQNEQGISMMKALLTNNMDMAKLREKYGQSGIEAYNKLTELAKKASEISSKANAISSMPAEQLTKINTLLLMDGKQPYDYMSLLKEQDAIKRQMDNILTTTMPDIYNQMQSLSGTPTVTPPNLGASGTTANQWMTGNLPDKTNTIVPTLHEQAIAVLQKGGYQNPSEQQIREVITRLQKKQK